MSNQKKKEICKGGYCCLHGYACNEFYPEGCHVHFIPIDLDEKLQIVELPERNSHV